MLASFALYAGVRGLRSIQAGFDENVNSLIRTVHPPLFVGPILLLEGRTNIKGREIHWNLYKNQLLGL
jgi:hypothetical protein